MYGYIFETTNNKTGATYIGKRYAVSFDKNYFGEENDERLALDIEKYGRPSFVVKMLMPYESKDALDEAFNAVKKPVVKQQKKTVKEEPKVEEPKKEEPVEEEVKPAPKKRASKKTVEEK